MVNFLLIQNDKLILKGKTMKRFDITDKDLELIDIALKVLKDNYR